MFPVAHAHVNSVCPVPGTITAMSLATLSLVAAGTPSIPISNVEISLYPLLAGSQHEPNEEIPDFGSQHEPKVRGSHIFGSQRDPKTGDLTSGLQRKPKE